MKIGCVFTIRNTETMNGFPFQFGYISFFIFAYLILLPNTNLFKGYLLLYYAANISKQYAQLQLAAVNV